MGTGDSTRVDWFSQKMRTKIRYGCDRDANYVKNIDLKSYPYPWTKDEWRQALGEDGCKWCVFLLEAQPIGFGVWKEHDETSDIEILRLCIKPTERRAGYGTRLLAWIEEESKKIGFGGAYMVIPEINCFPGHPDDVSEWLRLQGYAAETPILKDYRRMYGSLVDGFRFAKVIGGAPIDE